MNDFFTSEFLIRLLSSFVASMAFAALFKIRHKHLLFAGVGGMSCYAAYHTVSLLTPSLFTAALLSTMLAALLSELFARFRHAPTIVFSIPAVIPTVPGADLYYAMRALIAGDISGAAEHLMIAVKIGLGIAVGIISVSMVFGIITDQLQKIKK